MEKLTVHADVKFHSQMPLTSVDVCFRTRTQLEQLITGLQRLLHAQEGERLDLYLADPASYLPDAEETDSAGLATEVCFHPPGHVRDDLDLRRLAAARSHLESLLRDEG